MSKFNNSSADLDELISTRYVPWSSEEFDDLDDVIEVARTTDSCIFEEPINGGYDASPSLENIEMTAEEEEMFARFYNTLDEAGRLVSRLKIATDESLKSPTLWLKIPEESRRWERNNRGSELKLIDYIVKNINFRPSILHINFKRLVERDVPDIITECLHVDPSIRNRTVLRLSIRTEMPLRQILSQLDNLVETVPGFQVQKGMVTALLADHNLSDNTASSMNKPARYPFHKLLTTDVGEYAKAEAILENVNIHEMTSTVRFKCTILGNKHVRVNLVLINDISMNRKRIKFLDIEQHVSPKDMSAIRRHVTIAPREQNIIHEYEIPADSIFHSVSKSKKTHDLVEYLRSAQDEIHETKINMG